MHFGQCQICIIVALQLLCGYIRIIHAGRSLLSVDAYKQNRLVITMYTDSIPAIAMLVNILSGYII